MIQPGLLHQVISRRPVAVTIEQRADDPATQHSGKRFLISLRLESGDNLIALNNVFVGHVLALKNVDAGSVASHNLFWQNTTNASGSVVDSSVVADPLLDAGYRLQPSSPAIDAGVAHFEWNGDVVLDEAPGTYRGSAPDLGWQEASSSSGGGAPPTMTSVSVAPTSPGTSATLTANAAASDPDGDPISFTYQWLKNGSNIAGATSKTLNLAVSGNGDRGDQIAVTVRDRKSVV